MFLSTLNKNTCSSERTVMCEFKEEELLQPTRLIGRFTHNIYTEPSVIKWFLDEVPTATIATENVLLCLWWLSLAYLLLLLSLLLPLLLPVLNLEKRRLSHHQRCSCPWPPGVLDCLASACRDHRAPHCRDEWVPWVSVRLWACGGSAGAAECGGASWGWSGSFLFATWGWRVCVIRC